MTTVNFFKAALAQRDIEEGTRVCSVLYGVYHTRNCTLFYSRTLLSQFFHRLTDLIWCLEHLAISLPSEQLTIAVDLRIEQMEPQTVMPICLALKRGDAYMCFVETRFIRHCMTRYEYMDALMNIISPPKEHENKEDE